jgi:hypothetical protein
MTPVHCDTCATEGQLEDGAPCPKGWFYFEAKAESEPWETITIWVCSEACKHLKWQLGPGHVEVTAFVAEHEEEG